MRIRRYVDADVDRLVAVVSSALRGDEYANYKAGVDIDMDSVYNHLKSNVRNIQFFCNVVEVNDNIVGGMAAAVKQLSFSTVYSAVDLMLYVEKPHRNYKTVKELITMYVTWAQRRDVQMIELSTSSGYKQRQFATLAQRMGFHTFGSTFVMRTRP